MKKYLLSMMAMMIFCFYSWSIPRSNVFSFHKFANIVVKEAKNDTRTINEISPTNLDDLQNANDEQLNYWADSLEKFDGREFNYITPTRNQYNKNTCWVFAAVGIAETNILRKGIDKDATKENLDFDETIAAYNRHTRDGSQDPLFLTKNDFYNYGHWNQGDTGSPNALSIMTQGYTLLDENNFHSSVSNEVIKSKLKQSKYYVKSYQSISNNKEDIKRAILKYGGVTFNYSAPTSFTYFNNTATSNHTSFIIGWDDTIKTSSFSPKHPQNDGAWIIKNSWGDDFYKKNMINNTTAYYISYEQPIGGLYSIDIAMRDDYQNMYYYDGDVTINMNRSGGEAQGAIYEAKLSTSTKQEQLKAVMIYTPEDDLDINVKIYKHLNANPNNIYDPINIPEQNIPAIDMNTHINDTGMHTIDLDHPLNLDLGEYYSVVVRCKTKSSASVSIRCTQDTSTNDMTYFLENGKWTNFKSTGRTAKIRAITNLVDKEEDENLNDLQFAQVEIKNSIIEYVKNKDLIPEVQVYLDYKLLKKDQDYILKVQDIKSPGLKTLEIIGINNYKGTKTAIFEIKKAIAPPGIINETLTVYNDTEYLYDIPIPNDWTWVNENEKLEYETEYPVSLKYIGNDKDFYEIITCEFNIIKLDKDFPDSIDINNATIKILDNYTYTGDQIIPDIQITYENNLLHEGIDYLLTYDDNINAGIGKVFIKGKGHFCNKICKTFIIQKAPQPKEIPNNVINVNYKITNLNQIILNYKNWIWEDPNQEITSDTFKAIAIYIGDDSNNYINTKIEITIIKEKSEISSITELKLKDESFVYDGNEKTPTIIAIDETYTLIKDVDYKIEYQNNINAGIATIIIQGINNYKGTKTFNFTILKAEKPDIDTTIHYKGNVSTLSDISLPEGFIWEVPNQEITSDTFKAMAIYIGDDSNNYINTKIEITIIKEKSEISSITELKLKDESFVYDGNEKTPTIIAIDETYTLIKDVDYKIEYQNNINAGIATIIIQGINNYKGTKIFNFTILKAEKPNIDTTIHYKGNVSTLSDINIPERFVWEDPNQEITSDTFKAIAIYIGDDSNNYINTKIEITIIKEKSEISSITELKLEDEDFVYDGNEKTPTIIAIDETYTLIKDVDYKIEYKNNINAGIASVIIQGINNYKGTKIFNFTILKAEKPDIDTTIHYEGNVSTLSDISLPEGFIWEDENAEIVGNKMIARAVYVGNGANNYENTELTFEIILEEPSLNQKIQDKIIIIVSLVSLAVIALSFIFIKYRHKKYKKS